MNSKERDEILYIGNEKKTIFFVDENIDLLKKIGNLLLEYYPNYEVMAFDNLIDAEEELQKTKATILILCLEYKNGEDAIRFIKKLRLNYKTKKTPIIVTATRGTLEKRSQDILDLEVSQVPKAIRVPFLLGVVDSCLQQAARVDAKIVSLSAGETLFHAGEESSSVYILKSGELLVYREEDGEVFNIAELSGQQVVGEMAFIDRRPRSASIKASSDAVLIELQLGDVETFIEDQPFWLSMILGTLINRVRDSNQRIIKLEALEKNN